jgi:hypothetical protein
MVVLYWSCERMVNSRSCPGGSWIGRQWGTTNWRRPLAVGTRGARRCCAARSRPARAPLVEAVEPGDDALDQVADAVVVGDQRVPVDPAPSPSAAFASPATIAGSLAAAATRGGCVPREAWTTPIESSTVTNCSPRRLRVALGAAEARQISASRP